MRQTLLAALLLAPLLGLPAAGTPRPARPNILIAISDHLSRVHTSFAGYPAAKTPAIDRVAREGDYFRGATEPHRGCAKGSGLQAGKRL